MPPPSLQASPLARGLSLATLTLQNSALVLTLRHSRTLAGPAYAPTTAVLLCEAMKLVMSIGMLVVQAPGNHRLAALRRAPSDVLSPASKWWLLGVPAVLYTVQNNLQYQAVTRIDAASFAVTYQLKILTTALCSVWLLGRSLSRVKWGALVLLTAGVALVSLPSSHSAPAAPASSSATAASSAAAAARLVGLSCVLLACLSSGLAGVYFEKILKGSTTSLWVRNVQLALFSLVPALVGVVLVDGARIAEHGFFYGYTTWAWMGVLLQALGGILVALVVKYTDNILKGFATSISILLSSAASMYLFGFTVTPTFAAGAVLVLTATYMYSRPDPPSAVTAGGYVHLLSTPSPGKASGRSPSLPMHRRSSTFAPGSGVADDAEPAAVAPMVWTKSTSSADGKQTS